MCRRFTMLSADEVRHIITCLETGRPLEMASSTNTPHDEAFPGAEVPVIVTGADALEPRQLSWGFVLPDTGKLVFNTRLEKAAESRFWQASYQDRRCAVPALAFCETHRSEQTLNDRGKRMRQAYRFEPESSEPLVMAGIWQDGRFSVMTTTPDDNVAPVHDRMPLLLDGTGTLEWLAGEEPQRILPHLAATPLHRPAPREDGEQLGLF